MFTRVIKMINKAAWTIAEIYKEIIGECEKCGNKVLFNDTYDIPVVSCPICGKRYYTPDGMIEGIEHAFRPTT